MTDALPGQAEKALAFQKLHEGSETFVIPNPWDVGSARMMAGAGFKALATTSSGFGFSRGLGDGDVTLEQKLAHCRELNAATPLPVSADTENCFANDPEGVAAVIRQIIGTGIAGCSVEDYARDEPVIYDFDHAVERVAAAVEAAREADFPFTITARAEGLLRQQGDMDDIIRRLQAFEKVGADVLYAPALTSVEMVRQVVDAVSKPINVLAHPNLSVAELAGCGVCRISLGGALFRAAAGGLLRSLNQITEEGRFDDLKNAASFGQITKLFEEGTA